jgi:hypothetical protein
MAEKPVPIEMENRGHLDAQRLDPLAADKVNVAMVGIQSPGFQTVRDRVALNSRSDQLPAVDKAPLDARDAGDLSVARANNALGNPNTAGSAERVPELL